MTDAPRTNPAIVCRKHDRPIMGGALAQRGQKCVLGWGYGEDCQVDGGGERDISGMSQDELWGPENGSEGVR